MKKMIERFLFLCYITFERMKLNMNKNYYDILQINKNASPEIIEKAYKTLAKMYHPDLQSEENKKSSEEILKQINEAYEILSNPEKKKIYDDSLLKEENLNSANIPNHSDTNHYYNTTSTNVNHSIPIHELHIRQQKLQQEKQQQEQLQREQELAYQEQLQQARQQAYHDAYIQDLKNRGYKIRYKKSLKDYIKGIISILLTILVLFLLYQIPFIKNFFLNLYEENDIIRLIVNFIRNIFG